jgi:hypothetical protein
MATAIRQEFFLLPSADSVFIDSPLNFEGIEQVSRLILISFIYVKDNSNSGD